MPRWLQRVVAAYALVLVAIAVVALVLAPRGEDCETPFDRRAWLAARASGDDTVRGPRLRRLARRLVRCDELLGQPESQLRVVLGRPTRTAVDGNPRRHREAAWKLGTNDSPSNIDDYLLVEFDDHRAVYASAPNDVGNGGHDLARSGEAVGGGPIVR